MIHKQVLPESFDFGVPSVELIGAGSKGLDKTAMVKRASAFDDVLSKLEKKPNRTYLHVITTGAFQKYGANANCFVAGTPVITEQGMVPIQEVTPGYRVRTGTGTYKTVTRVISRLYTGTIAQIRMAQNHFKITATANHPICVLAQKEAQTFMQELSTGTKTVQTALSLLATLSTFDSSYKEASKICPDDYVINSFQITDKDMTVQQCKRLLQRVQSIQLQSTQEPITVYNLQVEGDHTYCVPYIVHNCDAWNGQAFDLDIPYPEDGKTKSIRLDGGLSKYHDDTYMKGGAVYQEHQTKRAGVQPSGEIICARYNPMMKRGQLLIAVDTNKWASRLQKKASGKDIYLSIGADVPRDLCFPRGTLVLTQAGYKDISKIKLGTLVYTASGNWKSVIGLSSRKTDALVELTVKGLPHSIKSTLNHPFSAVPQEDIKMAGCDENRWAAAVYIEKGDYLQIRKDKVLLDAFETVYKEWATTSDIPQDKILVIQRAFWAAGRPMQAIKQEDGRYALKECDEILIKDDFVFLPVTNKEVHRNLSRVVYNLEVEDDHTYNAEGADVHNCNICGRSAKTARQHCEHFTKHRGELFDCGKVACVMNDTPNFYDISGVDVPADRIAFVLQKVASGATTKQATVQALTTLGSRKPMLLCKAAMYLQKLSKMEKQVQGIIESASPDLTIFQDDDDTKEDFILEVENYPSDEIIDSCSRKGILLPPDLFFKLIGKDCQDGEGKNMLCDCCTEDLGDLSCLMQEFEEDQPNDELLDGSFDQHMPVDLNLDAILEKFMPMLGVTNPAIQSRSVKIIIHAAPEKEKDKKQEKEASFNKYAQDALRHTYARYLVSFAQQNNDATCRNALFKLAAY